MFGEAKKTPKTEIINYIMEANAIQKLKTLEDIQDRVELEIIHDMVVYCRQTEGWLSSPA